MKVWIIVLPILGFLVIAGAVTAYFVVAPPTLADDYEKKAEPEHNKVADTLEPVADSFNPEVFGTLPISSKGSPEAYLRRYKRSAAKDRRELATAARAVRKAKRTLARIDEEAMTDAPSWPLLGGDLDEAKDVAAMQDDYLRKARAFVKDYEALVAYEQFMAPVIDRLNISDAEAQAAAPETPTSPSQITRPLQRLIRIGSAQLKRVQRRKPPAEIKHSHRRTVANMKKGIANYKALVAAVNGRDIGRINAIIKRMNSEGKKGRGSSRRELRRLIDNSRYAKQIEDLERRENRIAKAFEAL